MSSPPAEVRLTDETIEHLRAQMRDAVSDGLRETLNDPKALSAFWGSAFDELRTQATASTGRAVLGGLRGIASRAATFFLLGSLVYALGGWTAVAKLWHTLWGAT